MRLATFTRSIEITRDFNFLSQNKILYTMDITSLYNIDHNDKDLRALKHFFDQRTNFSVNTTAPNLNSTVTTLTAALILPPLPVRSTLNL